MLKTFDYFEVCKLCFKSSCGLNNLLRANNYEVKSSSGTQAIQWAKQRDWTSLEEYCLRDARLTYEISVSAQAVIIPLTGWEGSTVTFVRGTGRNAQPCQQQPAELHKDSGDNQEHIGRCPTTIGFL